MTTTEVRQLPDGEELVLVSGPDARQAGPRDPRERTLERRNEAISSAALAEAVVRPRWTQEPRRSHS